MRLTAPFPYFGGKSKIASIVWDAFGDDLDLYIEPFAGSLAVMLAAPYVPDMESVNDMDHFIVNFWRSVKQAPEEVAKWANNLNSEADLFSRHMWLVNAGKESITKCEIDPDYYDAKVAGWWVWGIANWIGGGWCSGTGSWRVEDGELTNGSGQGVNRKRLHLSDAGVGTDTGLVAITEYMQALAARLRYTRVSCGDWERICTRGAMIHRNHIGVFLDPPYSNGIRSDGLYTHDDGDVTRRVEKWCLDNQDDPRLRIVLAGYDGEYDLPGWRVVAWKQGASYQRSTSAGKGNDLNRHKERLWLSPGCVQQKQMMLLQVTP